MDPNISSDSATEDLLWSRAIAFVNEGGAEGLRDLLARLPALANTREASTGRGLIHLGVMRGQVAIVRCLLEFGADPNLPEGHFVAEDDNSKYKPGYTPLQYAARLGSLAMVGLLLSRGASPDIRDYAGGTPLHAANASIAAVLLGAGAPVEAVCYDRTFDEEYGWRWIGRPIETAAIAGDAETIRVLVAHGARLDWFEVDRRTPVHAAAAYGQADALVALLEAGADPNALSNQYEYSGTWSLSPLHFTAKNGHLDAAKVLLKFGADPTLRSAVTNAGSHVPKGWGHDLPERFARDYGHSRLSNFLRRERSKWVAERLL